MNVRKTDGNLIASIMDVEETKNRRKFRSKNC